MRLGVREYGPAEPRERGGSAHPIGAWLGLFGALAGLPRRERAEVEEELSDHLRERVRELMVRGLDEHEAVRAAIEELGGAAEMAARFRSVTANSRRRLAMNLSMLGLAGTAAVLSLVAVLQPGAGGGARVYTPSTSAQATGPAAKVIDVSFADASLADVAQYLGEAAGVSVIVHRSDLEGLADSRLNIQAKRVTVAGALALVKEASPEIDYRITGETLEIGTGAYFDHRERTLASYDLGPAAEQGADSEQVLNVIQSLVESDGWQVNGGDLASAYVLGSRVFVEAPPRYHEKIRWILEELTSAPQAALPAGGAQDEGFRRYILSYADATSLCERLRGMVGDAEGLRIVPDTHTNSIIVGGSPEAVEAALVSGLDVAKGADASGAADAEPVFVVIEYDGKQEVLAVDTARIVTRNELFQNRVSPAGVRLDLQANVHRDGLVNLELTPIPWFLDSQLNLEPASETPR